MKLITLNTWGGRVGEPLLKFFKNHQDIDIFCLQEIYSGGNRGLGGDEDSRFSLLEELREILPNHVSYFRPSVEDFYGITIFIKKEIKVKEEGEIIISKVDNWQSDSEEDHGRNLQYLQIEKDGKNILIANVHGLWTGTGKGDTPKRLEQSKIIREFMDKRNDAYKILCGDFNLLPDTESVDILATDMQNLIKENNIQSTRTSLYTREVRHADYIFASKEIKVEDFKVLPDEVSDHSPLYLEFDLI